MTRIFLNRDKILKENLDHDGYRNASLRCRPKMSPTKNAFEKRLADVLLSFSALANIGFALVKDLAKVWFLKGHPSTEPKITFYSICFNL